MGSNRKSKNSSNNIYVVYALLDEYNQPRYVGRSVNGIKRAKQHGRTSTLKKDGNTHKANWIRSMQARGLQYGYTLLNTLPSLDDMYKCEEYWISYFRQIGCELTNATDGGEREANRVISEESRKRMSEAHVGKPSPKKGKVCWTAEQRKEIGDRQRGRPGKKWSEESKKKMSERCKGRSVSPEAREKISKTLTGRKLGPRDPEIGKKIAASRRGKKLSDASKENMRKAALERWNNQPMSEEIRKKISEANKGKERSPEHIEKLKKSLTGRTLSPEHRDAISKGKLGTTYTHEHSSKISESLKRFNKNKREQKEEKNGDKA